jgi:hypothetical protein
VKAHSALKLLAAGHNGVHAPPECTGYPTLRYEATVLIEFPIGFQLSKMYANSFKENNLNFVPGFLSG